MTHASGQIQVRLSEFSRKYIYRLRASLLCPVHFDTSWRWLWWTVVPRTAKERCDVQKRIIVSFEIRFPRLRDNQTSPTAPRRKYCESRLVVSGIDKVKSIVARRFASRAILLLRAWPPPRCQRRWQPSFRMTWIVYHWPTTIPKVTIFKLLYFATFLGGCSLLSALINES